jgi:Ser/Thr protein kinase RdoA (MazF antagonist)
MPLGEPIARGRTAEIYPWRNGWVLKLFYAWVPAEHAAHETRVARTVHAVGLAVPEVGETVEVDDRIGLTYEWLEGPSMGEEMTAKPWRLVGLARQLAQLHADIHAVEGLEGMPSQRERLRDRIQEARGLDDGLRRASLRALERMPDGQRLCHGDLHPWNVIMVGGRAMAIDWFGATRGNPLADLARTALVVEGVRRMTEMVTWRERLVVRPFRRVVVKGYFELRPGGEAEYRAWWPIIAAGRMSEGIPGLADWLRSQI